MCDRILAAEPGDADALHAKVISLIELNKCSDALQILESAPALASGRAFERAYCLYTLNRESEALELLMPGGAQPDEPKAMQLVAQIKYRLGEWGAAAAYFLQSESAAGRSSELSTNIIAALVSAGKGDEALEYASSIDAGEKSSGASPSTQFELYYNRACAAISVGELDSAKTLINSAIELCKDTLTNDDYSEEEIEARRPPARPPPARPHARTHSGASCVP